MPVVVRPSFLLVEPNPEEALSSRKLVVESAKFNILTAHSEPEAIQQFEKFPLVDAVILHTRLEGYDRVASHVKQQNGRADRTFIG